MLAGIILAAGLSQRMGEPKMLLPWRGQPLVRHGAQLALSVPLEPVVVVTGHAANQVAAAVADLPVVVTHNPAYQQGQSGSLIAGLRALPDRVTAAMVLLVDQPLLTPDVLRQLATAHAHHPAAIVAPVYGGQRGNPVIFPRSFWPLLLALEGDTGARTVIQSHRDQLQLVPVDSLGVVADADTPDDFRALEDQAGSSTS